MAAPPDAAVGLALEAPRALAPCDAPSGDGWHSFASVPDAAAVVFDPSSSSRAVVAATAGIGELTGYSADELLGSVRETLQKGVPDACVSRSARKNFGNFCDTALLPGVVEVAETSAFHASARKDGMLFSSLEMLGHCRVGPRPYVMAVYIWLAEGPIAPRLPAAKSADLKEQARDMLKRLRRILRQGEAPQEQAPADSAVMGKTGMIPRGMSFFNGRLQERTILFEGSRSAARREPEELPIGCLMFGSSPMIPTEEGLRFAVRVDAVSTAFRSLPVLGFTRRRPADEPGLHPAVARCLGRSVLVGADGEAFARDHEKHFVVGLRKIPPTEVETWCLDKEVPPHQRTAPARPRVGDVVECRYTWEGRLQFWLNDVLVIDFDVGRPLEAGGVYWPVVDVCHSVAAVTWEPQNTGPSGGSGQCVALSDASTTDWEDDGNDAALDTARDVDARNTEGKEIWSDPTVMEVGPPPCVPDVKRTPDSTTGGPSGGPDPPRHRRCKERRATDSILEHRVSRAHMAYYAGVAGLALTAAGLILNARRAG